MNAARPILYRSTIVWQSLDRHVVIQECEAGHRYLEFMAWRHGSTGEFQWYEPGAAAGLAALGSKRENIRSVCPHCEIAAGLPYLEPHYYPPEGNQLLDEYNDLLAVPHPYPSQDLWLVWAVRDSERCACPYCVTMRARGPRAYTAGAGRF